MATYGTKRAKAEFEAKLHGGMEPPRGKTCGDRMVEEWNKAINKNLNAQLMSYNDARTERLDTQLEELYRQRDYYAAREAYLKEQSK
jgi:hypothetical protein